MREKRMIIMPGVQQDGGRVGKERDIERQKERKAEEERLAKKKHKPDCVHWNPRRPGHCLREE